MVYNCRETNSCHACATMSTYVALCRAIAHVHYNIFQFLNLCLVISHKVISHITRDACITNIVTGYYRTSFVSNYRCISIASIIENHRKTMYIVVQGSPKDVPYEECI